MIANILIALSYFTIGFCVGGILGLKANIKKLTKSTEDKPVDVVIVYHGDVEI